MELLEDLLAKAAFTSKLPHFCAAQNALDGKVGHSVKHNAVCVDRIEVVVSHNLQTVLLHGTNGRDTRGRSAWMDKQ